MSSPRLYTVDEARALLPRVVPVLERIREIFAQLRDVQVAVGEDEHRATTNGHLHADPWAKGAPNRLEQLKAGLQQEVMQLDGWGIDLKDPDRGLIDFSSERDGEVVLLCYHLGEETITHWHRVEDGFAGRQPL